MKPHCKLISGLASVLMIFGMAHFTGSALADPDPPATEKQESKTETGKKFDHPTEQLQLYLDAFHYVKNKPAMQMEVHHYCGVVNPDLTQCALYDKNTKNAHLIGIEYVISDKLYNQLSATEKNFWHPHPYEIKSGQLIAPELSGSEEHTLMNKLYRTHGKTWHLWDPMQKKLPVGNPDLMWSFTKDGQLKASLLTQRDKRFGISSPQKKSARADIPMQAKAAHTKK